MDTENKGRLKALIISNSIAKFAGKHQSKKSHVLPQCCHGDHMDVFSSTIDIPDPTACDEEEEEKSARCLSLRNHLADCSKQFSVIS